MSKTIPTNKTTPVRMVTCTTVTMNMSMPVRIFVWLLLWLLIRHCFYITVVVTVPEIMTAPVPVHVSVTLFV